MFNFVTVIPMHFCKYTYDHRYIGSVHTELVAIPNKWVNYLFLAMSSNNIAWKSV